VGAARAQHLSDVKVEVDAEWLNTYEALKGYGPKFYLLLARV
jgi:hypothetical protein